MSPEFKKINLSPFYVFDSCGVHGSINNMFSRPKHPSFYIGVAINIIAFAIAGGLPMIVPSTPLNGFIICMLGLMVSIPFFAWAYALYRGNSSVKDIIPKTRLKKMIACLGFIIIVVGVVLLLSQLDFQPSGDNKKPPTKEPTDIIQQKNNETSKEIPDLTKAKRETQIISIDQFDSQHINKLKVDILGYFELSANPAPEKHYSYVIVKTKEKFSGHYYASVQMGAFENVQTMDLIGNICICISPRWEGFFIWESEQSQKGWFPINIKQKIHPHTNTVSVYQNGKNVSVFINNEFVGDFIRQKPPSQGQVGIGIKANKNTGGKMFFQSFAVWEFQ